MQESASSHVPGSSTHRFLDLDGQRFIRIDDVATTATFLMSLVSAGDLWAFVASNGALTAGRRDPDHAILPYYTEDRMVDDVAGTGATTVVRVGAGPLAGTTWEPTCGSPPVPEERRWLAKSVSGDEILLGADQHRLGLSLRYSWRASERHGLVRRCTLVNTGSQPVSLQLLDGLVNLVPAGATRQTQNNLSNLLDAYKLNEIVPPGLGLYSLNSGLTDLAEPAESLTATIAWRLGPPPRAWLASGEQLDRFRRGGVVDDEPTSRGLRGAFLAAFDVDLPPGEQTEWTVVVDTDIDSARATDALAALGSPHRLADDLDDDLRRGRDRLRRLMAAADGLQLGGDESASAHHLASVTFNAMRGGLPIEGYTVGRAHFAEFVQRRSQRVADTHAAAIGALPAQLCLADLHAFGERSGDPDLVRLTLSFLPLTFSRRHGDPSRPWNRFEISVTDRHGEAAPGYQGNWRDIFQNWEALAWSYPELIEGMVANFVNATTVDGYNPYRITHNGVDWEVPEPDNPWANIGYWSDHQVVYLARLIGLSQRFHPGLLASYLGRALFTTADVPYRIAPFDDLLADPVNTITFDAGLDRQARDRSASEGTDGLLRQLRPGRPELTTLADKLLLLVATKTVNFVPGAGIWMNTQRPEWNDANNALVGHGCSVVTTAQLLGFARQLSGLLGRSPAPVRSSLADLVVAVTPALETAADTALDDHGRRSVMEQLGRAGDSYRARAYAAADDPDRTLTGDEVDRFLRAVSRSAEATLRSSRRADGLFHSYNTLHWDGSTARIQRLPLMLEGQVALLGSGLLDPEESLTLIGALRRSPLYRADRRSYLLYPDKEVPGFLEKNNPRSLRAVPGLAGLLADPDQNVIVADSAGGLHFAPGIANRTVLERRIEELGPSTLAGLTTAGREALRAAYAENFRHHEFTGRSGSFFAYEGLGSIYWHMVSKLLLAVGEVTSAAARERGPHDPTVRGLLAAYRDVRSGLGFATSAAEFGAFPTDPYSHTPRHSGARQPGMTGQVKEDILSRFAELGLSVDGGRITLDPSLVDPGEWTTTPATFGYVDLTGDERTIELPPRSLAFTFCQVPFIVDQDPDHAVRILAEDGSWLRVEGHTLDAALSREVFARTGRVAQIRVGRGRGPS